MNFFVMRKFTIIFVLGLRPIYSSNESNCVDEEMDPNPLRLGIAKNDSKMPDQATMSSNANNANTSLSEKETVAKTYFYPDWMFEFDGNIKKYFETTTKSNEFEKFVKDMCNFWKYESGKSLGRLDKETCCAMKLFCFTLGIDFLLKKICGTALLMLFDYAIIRLAFAYNLFINYEIPKKPIACNETINIHYYKIERAALLILLPEKIEALEAIISVLKTLLCSANISPDIPKSKKSITEHALVTVKYALEKSVRILQNSNRKKASVSKVANK